MQHSVKPYHIGSYNQHISSLIEDKRITYKTITFKNVSLIDSMWLQKNEKYLCDKICKRTIFGNIVSNNDYMHIFKLFLQSTKETEHRKMFFKQLVSSKDIEKNYFLEVGVGNAEITRIIASDFKHTTLVDPNLCALNSIDANSFQKNNAVKKVNQSICDTALPINHYDFIAISHLLYYIKSEQWPSLIKKIYRSLRPKGMLVIVLSSGLDKTRIIEHFSGYSIDLDQVVIDLHHACNGEMHVTDIADSCYSYSKMAALHIAGFYLNDGQTHANMNELSQVIMQFKKQHFYRYQFIQRFITIKKLQN